MWSTSAAIGVAEGNISREPAVGTWFCNKNIGLDLKRLLATPKSIETIKNLCLVEIDEIIEKKKKIDDDTKNGQVYLMP